jgi:hypothetical protein
MRNLKFFCRVAGRKLSRTEILRRGRAKRAAKIADAAAILSEAERLTHESN